MNTRTSIALLCSLVAISACGSGSAVRPKDPTASGALGEGSTAICHDVKADGTPLVVDWPPTDRTDLEVALKRGVAFVHYDCDSIKLLPDCSADGVYGFVGVTRKEEVISLANADEAKANLPFNGGSLGGGITQGTSLDIGLVMVGKRATTFSDITKDDMKGKCTGATHFVRSGTVGAFAMKTETAGSVSGAAQLFGVGASASSSSDKSAANKDGDLDACKQSDPDATKPPGQCGALLRVQLVAIGDSKGGDEVASLNCPAGLVPVNGKCTASADESAKKCHANDAEACAVSCRANNGEACITWSDLMINKALGEKSTAYDANMAEAFKRGCDLQNDEMCAMLATSYASGRGVARDGAKALELANKSCLAGAAVGCTITAGIYDRGMGVPADRARGTHLYERACNAGSDIGCIAAAQAYGEGRPGITVDRAKMVDYFDRACDAGEPYGCVNAGKSYEAGDGVAASLPTAAGFYRRGCLKKNQVACDAQKRLAAGH